MLIYTIRVTPRLQYIIDFFSAQLTGQKWQITLDPNTFYTSPGPKINYSYSKLNTNSLHIIPHSLLFEDNLSPQQISIDKKEGFPIFFQTECDTGFDIFAATFYLLSRYEEYLPHDKDIHGRYMPENSLAWKYKFLHTPVIHYWIIHLKKYIQRLFPDMVFKQTSFSFLPTYDIDMAWNYKHKGLLRNGYSLFKDIARLDFKKVNNRIHVLTGKLADPFDHFEWLHQLHTNQELHPHYFFLMAEKTAKYDRNNSPQHPAMKKLVKSHAALYSIGIHPSYQSHRHKNILKQEKDILQITAGKEITASRQHFLKMSLPATYQNLIRLGLTEDYTMGYASEFGFRASIATPFYWFDLERNQGTTLKIYPFCFMDATAIYYKKLTPQLALEQLTLLLNEVKQLNALFCMIWHNNTFANQDWKMMYEQFIKQTTYKS